MGELATHSQQASAKRAVNYALLRIANFLTAFRLLATPVVVYSLWMTQAGREYDFIALGVIFVLQATDIADGYLARKAQGRVRVNATGEVLDPIADKLYLNSAYITLMVVGRVPIWVGGLIVLRDLLIATGWLTKYYRAGIRLLPNAPGKAADSAHALLILAVLLAPPDPVLSVAMVVTALLTVLSGLSYARMFRQAGRPDES